MLQEFSAGGGPEPGPPGRPRAGKYDQLWQLSMADPHTGLANQLLLLDRLTQALARRRRHGGEVVVCHIDLDNLGEINMDLGYTTGNQVLVEMSRRLTSVLRTEDTVGRVGGSELVVVLTVSDEQAVGTLTRRLQHTLDEPVAVGGQGVRLVATMGVAVAEDNESAEDLLARADRSTRVGHR
jgi:diguanylate cyclase (GGDEF)-like protein